MSNFANLKLKKEQMKRLKTLVLALSVLTGLTLTSCLNTDSDPYQSAYIMGEVNSGIMSMTVVSPGGISVTPTEASVMNFFTSQGMTVADVTGKTVVAYYRWNTETTEIPADATEISGVELYWLEVLNNPTLVVDAANVGVEKRDSVATHPIISLNYEVSGFTYKPYFYGENSTTLILPVNYYVPVGVTSSLTLVYYPDDAATVTDKEQGILRLYLNFRANTDADYSTDYESYALALYGGLGYFNKAYDLGTSAGGGRSILAEWGGSLPSEIRIVVSENPYSTDLENGNTTQHEYEVLSWDEYVDSLPL